MKTWKKREKKRMEFDKKEQNKTFLCLKSFSKVSQCSSLHLTFAMINKHKITVKLLIDHLALLLFTQIAISSGSHPGQTRHHVFRATGARPGTTQPDLCLAEARSGVLNGPRSGINIWP